MNIFYLDSDAQVCAEMHNDKHVVKMILEYAQLLSTAHRVLDGVEIIEKKYVLGSLPARWRKCKVWKLNDDRDSILYKATHMNHPSAKWARHSIWNYYWLYTLLNALCKEYTFRYGKIHKCERSGLLNRLQTTPISIPIGHFTAPWRAMPDEFKVDRAITDYTVKSYRAYYLGAKVKMSRWTDRAMPVWFADGINSLYEDACYVEHKPKLNKIISMPLQYANL